MEASKWFYKGLENIRSKHYEEAIYCFTESLKINPKKATPWYNLGIAFLHLNLDPFFHQIFFLINFFTFKSKPYYLENKIENCFKNAVNIDPQFLDAWHNLGFFYFELEEYEKAITCFKAILEYDSENIDNLYLLGKSYQELKDYNSELDCLTKVIALSHKKSNLPMKQIKKRIKVLEQQQFIQSSDKK